MLLESIQESSALYSTTAEKAYTKQQQEEPSLFPASWGTDSVNISDEARAAQQSSLAGEQQGEEDEAAAAFSKYMDKARGTGDSASSGSVEEKIEELKKKLKQLQAQMGQVAQNQTMSEEAKEGRISGLQAEMNSVISQIAELESQLAEAKAGSA